MVPFGLNGITVPMREKHGSENGSRASHRGFSAVAGEAQGGAEALSAAPSAGGTGLGGALLPAPRSLASRSPPCSRPSRYRRPRQRTGFMADCFVGAAQTAQAHGGGKLRVASRAPPELAEIKFRVALPAWC